MPHIKDPMGFPMSHEDVDAITVNALEEANKAVGIGDVDAANLIAAANLNPSTTAGVSNTDMSTLNAGVLNTLPAYQQALAIADQVYKKREPISPAMLSFLFFTKMAEEASKPGATALGAAGAAAATPAAYLMKERELDAADKKAKATMAATLTTSLSKAPAKANAYTEKGDTTGQVKYYTPTAFAALPEATKNNLVPYSAKTSASLKEYVTNVDIPVGSLRGNKEIIRAGTKVQLTPDEAGSLSPTAISAFNKPAGGSKEERYMKFLTDNSAAIKDGSADEKTKSTYSSYYQSLTKGYTTTVIEDGVEKTVRVAGIDLTNTSLPVPEGFDAEKILSEKSQDFGPKAVTATFGQRMLYNEGIVRNVLEAGYENNFADLTADNFSGWFGSTLQTPEGQEFYSASRNFIAAVLRKESGAAISDGEYVNGLKQYFPQIGDTATVVEQKEALRAESIRGMINDSGDAFAFIYPDAVPFLTFKDGDTTYEVLNPRGYTGQALAKLRQGKSLYFKSQLDSLSVQDLKGMLSAPNAGTRYTQTQLDQISAEIDRKENQ